MFYVQYQYLVVLETFFKICIIFVCTAKKKNELEYLFVTSYIQVRAAAAGKLKDFCQNLEPESGDVYSQKQETVIMNNILPCVKVCGSCI